MTLPPFAEAVAALVSVLDQLGIVYPVGGSVASLVHGEVRTTQDVDLVVDLAPERLGPLAVAHLTEGSHRNWSDSHHWDLDLGNRGLCATHRTGRHYELGQRPDLEIVYLSYRSYALDGWIDVVYRRR